MILALLALVVVVLPGSFAASLAERLNPTPDPHLADPAGWVRKRLQQHPWSKQVEVLESVRDNRRTVVHSSHAVGKSRVAAWVAAWWIECHPAGTAFVVSTAPSWSQVRTILWRYINEVHRKGGLRGRLNQTEWWLGDEQVGYGRKPPDSDEAGFQGVHAKFVLVLVDEAGGIPGRLWRAILALLTTRECRVLAIGNPDYEGSEFSKRCQPGSGWNVIHIDGLGTPNFTDEPCPPDAPLIDQSFVDDVIADYGLDSPQYLITVRGLFPKDRSDGVVPWSWASRCRLAECPAPVGALRVPVELGVDVGGGGDLTVIRERRGGVVGRRWWVNTQDSEEIVARVLAAVDVSGATAVKVDFGGIGFGVSGSLKAHLERRGSVVVVHEVVFGATPKDPERFENVRAEMYWEARLALRDERWWLGGTVGDVTGKPFEGEALVDDRTVADVTEPRWFENRRGRIQVEPKDDIRKRLGRSPDDGDALVLAFYDPPAPGGEQPLVSVPYRAARTR
jgi:hypothetical protein